MNFKITIQCINYNVINAIIAIKMKISNMIYGTKHILDNLATKVESYEPINYLNIVNHRN